MFWFLQYLWGIETNMRKRPRHDSQAVFTVPMRNWNLAASIKSNISVSFLQYLWGIETYTFKFPFPKIVWFLQYLWGIETSLVELIKIKLLMQVFTVPMRNWNFFYQHLLHKLFSVFTVPMRNWNYKKLEEVFPEVKRFYSTYEELKLEIRTHKTHPEKCFYSTYEELKPLLGTAIGDQILQFLQYLWGIETGPSCS